MRISTGIALGAAATAIAPAAATQATTASKAGAAAPRQAPRLEGTNEAALHGSLYDNVAAVLGARYHDETFRKEQLPALIQKHRPRDTSEAAQREAVQALLAEIPATHLALLSQNTYERLMSELAGEPKPTLGFDLTRLGDRYFAANVLEGGSAWRAGIRAGDEVLSLDGLRPEASPMLDWRSDDAFLDDERDPPMHFLKVKDGQPVKVALKKTADGPSTDLIVSAELDSAQAAAKRSVRALTVGDRQLGYVHFWYVHFSGTSDILRDALAGPLANVDGLILDLRGRGGSGTEIPAILKLLDDAHAARALPVVALIDRQTRSAKDVLARELSKRPWVRLVGEPTAGAVIPATFTPVGHEAILMYPSFTLGSLTEELEGKGGVKPQVDAPRPGPYAGGIDPILNAGAGVLMSGPKAGAASAAMAAVAQPQVSVPTNTPPWPRLKEKILAALGGQKAVAGWKSRKLEGTSELVGLPMKGAYRQIVTPDGRFRTDANFGSFKVAQAFDGSRGWSLSPQAGVVTVGPQMLERMKTQSGFLGPLGWDQGGRKARVAGGTVFAERPAYEVIVSDPAGDISFFVDAETYNLLGSKSEIDSPVGRVRAISTFRNYKTFGNVPVPTEVIVEAAGQKQRFVIEKVTFEEPQAGAFAPPSQP